MSLHTQPVGQRVTLTIAGTPWNAARMGGGTARGGHVVWSQGRALRVCTSAVALGVGRDTRTPSPAPALTSACPCEESSHFSAKGT